MHQTKKELFRCDECQGLGYCKKARANAQSVRVGINEDIVRIFADTLAFKTPLDAKSIIGKQLQAADHLLWEEDFQSAMCLYKAATTDGHYWEAYVGLSLCCFYTEEYDKAAFYADHIQTDGRKDWTCAVSQFIALCERNACTNKSPSQQRSLFDTHIITSLQIGI